MEPEYTQIHKDWYHRDCFNFCYYELPREQCRAIARKAYYYDPLHLMSDKGLLIFMEEEDE